MFRRMKKVWETLIHRIYIVLLPLKIDGKFITTLHDWRYYWNLITNIYEEKLNFSKQISSLQIFLIYRFWFVSKKAWCKGSDY